MTRPKPRYVCHNCGIAFCERLPGRGATYSLGKCECCGAEDVPCTEPRDYGGFKVWPLPREIDPLPTPEELIDLVEPVLDHFDFAKVRKAMEVLNWQWIGETGGEGMSIPSIDRMKRTARNLLVNTVTNKRYNCSAVGGFLAEKSINNLDRMDDGLILRFILDQSESYFGDYYDEN